MKIPKHHGLERYRRGNAGKPRLSTIHENNSRNYYVELIKNQYGLIRAGLSNKSTPKNAIEEALNYGNNYMRPNNKVRVRVFRSPRSGRWIIERL